MVELSDGTFLPRIRRDPGLRTHAPYVAVLERWPCWGGLSRCRPEDIERRRTRGQAGLGVMETHLARAPWFLTGTRGAIRQAERRPS